MRVCDAAFEVLRRTNNPGVMTGDVHLLTEIAEQAGVELCGPGSTRKILDALTRQPGILVPELVGSRIRGRHRNVRYFGLPVENLT